MVRFATAASAAAALIVGAAGAMAPSASQAAVSVYGSGFAEQCFHVARDGGDPRAGIADCDRAIATEMLDSRDLAGTLVNRGVLHMVAAEYAAAEDDFRASIKLNDKLGEAYVNLGAVEIERGHFAAGITDINQGLTLGSEEPEKAYYNRALADESLGDVKSAYFDYTKAAELKPTWTAPRLELSRFTVRPAS